MNTIKQDNVVSSSEIYVYICVLMIGAIRYCILTLSLRARSLSSISTVNSPVNTMFRMSMMWLKPLDCS